ncbi:unnamed protein product [Musa textilis]
MLGKLRPTQIIFFLKEVVEVMGQLLARRARDLIVANDALGFV